MPTSRPRRGLPAVLGLLVAVAACGAPLPPALPPASLEAPAIVPATATPTTPPPAPPTIGTPTSIAAPARTAAPPAAASAAPAAAGPARADPTRTPATPPAAPGGPAASAVGEASLHRITCDQSEAEVAASGAPRVTRGGATIYIGGQQVGGDDQAPRVVRFDGGERTWCREDLERTGDDGRGYGLLWSDDLLLGVFSAVGNQGDPSADLRRFTADGWLRSYADGSPRGGGGAKVAVLVRLDPATGAGIPGTGTWITADNDGRVNSATVTGLALTGDGVRVTVESASTPRRADRSDSDCAGSSPFTATYTFDRALRSARSVALDDRCA